MRRRISKWCWAGSGATTPDLMDWRLARCLPSAYQKRWTALRGALWRNGKKAKIFQAFIKRIGKVECKKMLDDLGNLPPHDQDPSFYTDWHDPREYTLGDLGIGECAGEVVTPLEFQLTACERESFEAQLALEKGDAAAAAKQAYEAMLNGAKALLAWRKVFFLPTADGIVEAFRKEFYDTELFFDPFAGGKFAQFLFRAHEHAGDAYNAEAAHRLIEETQLFIEACHSARCACRTAASAGAA
jgi:sulfite reductase (ferredoxin)